uniref:tumor necrosis factor receptor superfamily member 5-like n=1 Tax=Semicossyphus pulcher TaxID=241346 RepID=UPI0037E7278B
MFRGTLWSAASLLMLVLNVFRGHALTCDQSEYKIGNRCCPKCLPGSRVQTDCSSESNHTSCLPCTEGTFMNQPTDRMQCFYCRDCDAGSGVRIKTSCTQTSNTVCEPLEGFYCTDSAEGSCAAAQSYTSCRPGEYIRQRGTSQRVIDCSACSDGTFSDGTFTSCRPHTQCQSKYLQLLKAGTDSTDAQCGGLSTFWIMFIVSNLVLILSAVLYLALKQKRLQKQKRERKEEIHDLVCFLLSLLSIYLTVK